MTPLKFWQHPHLPLFFAAGLIAACDPAQDMEAAAEPGAIDGDRTACWPQERDGGDVSEDLSVMQDWGAPCVADADCIPLLGADAICMLDAVIYELPGGYCTKSCSLTVGTTVTRDDPACDPAGGVHCVGAPGFFERCMPGCTDESQCGRDGYFCRLMPLIGQADDPKLCIMHDCCEESCE